MRLKWVIVLVVLVGAGVGACDRTPVWPDGDVELVEYRNPNVGYSVLRPAVCRIHEYEGGTIFRYDGAPIMCVNFETEDGAKRRGLWAKHDPVAEADLGGRRGEKFRYDHYDGPIFMRTLSYVVPHKGKYVALEFRSRGGTITELQDAIIASFRFVDDASRDAGHR